MCSLFLLAAALTLRTVAPHTEGVADQVRIRRSEIGKRLAQRGIFQAESVRILAAGEYPSACLSRTVGDACPYKRYFTFLEKCVIITSINNFQKFS